MEFYFWAWIVAHVGRDRRAQRKSQLYKEAGAAVLSIELSRVPPSKGGPGCAQEWRVADDAWRRALNMPLGPAI